MKARITGLEILVWVALALITAALVLIIMGL